MLSSCIAHPSGKGARHACKHPCQEPQDPHSDRAGHECDSPDSASSDVAGQDSAFGGSPRLSCVTHFVKSQDQADQDGYRQEDRQKCRKLQFTQVNSLHSDTQHPSRRCQPCKPPRCLRAELPHIIARIGVAVEQGGGGRRQKQAWRPVLPGNGGTNSERLCRELCPELRRSTKLAIKLATKITLRRDRVSGTARPKSTSSAGRTRSARRQQLPAGCRKWQKPNGFQCRECRRR